MLVRNQLFPTSSDWDEYDIESGEGGVEDSTQGESAETTGKVTRGGMGMRRKARVVRRKMSRARCSPRLAVPRGPQIWIHGKPTLLLNLTPEFCNCMQVQFSVITVFSPTLVVNNSISITASFT